MNDPKSDSPNPTATEPAPAPTRAIAVLPSYLDVEDVLARAAESENVMRLASTGDVVRLEAYLQSRAKACEVLRRTAIKATHGQDWTLYKDPEGREVGVPRDAAAVVIKKWLGIRLYGHKPIGSHGEPEPRITEEVVERDGKPLKVKVAEMWASGFSTVTGEVVEDVYFAKRSDEDFVGRGTLQDLKASCRTGVDAKIIRILSGLRKVPKEQLTAEGLKEKDFHLGRGYGKSDERRASKVSDEGVPELREKLRREILRLTGGNTNDAKSVLVDITKSDTFKGNDSVDRMTQVWQFENAFKKLIEHPLYTPPPAPGAAPQANGTASKKP